MKKMTSMNVVLDGDGKLSHLQNKKVHLSDIDTILALPGGMASGKPSVGVVIPLDDGSYVFAETSLALLQMATRAFTAKYGDQCNE